MNVGGTGCIESAAFPLKMEKSTYVLPELLSELAVEIPCSKTKLYDDEASLT